MSKPFHQRDTVCWKQKRDDLTYTIQKNVSDSEDSEDDFVFKGTFTQRLKNKQPHETISETESVHVMFIIGNLLLNTIV